MRVGEAMTPVQTPLEPGTPLLEAARRMAALGTPALPVCDHGVLVGLLSERALVFGAVQEDSDDDEIPASEGRVDRAMLRTPPTCGVDEPLDEVMARAIGTGVGHLVVVDAANVPVGVLSLRSAWASEAPAGDVLR